MSENEIRMACLQLAASYSHGDAKMVVNVASHFYDFVTGIIHVDAPASREIRIVKKQDAS